ncbi:DNA topoisomerase 1 [Phtheirospermum japonicum]|uniref:DNA topoisomerase I n=1 Tax=Phtheirospermum japonicum TaxID=374723 RepID=A0A830BH31_9LAMI|nr:DNA topoisomerase 1 [Phtheirospermum japonicum]
MAVEACDKQKLMDDMDEDEVPLVFKRSSSSSSKQNQSTSEAKKSLSQKPDRQVGRPAQDVRSQNGQGTLQKSKMVSSSKTPPINSPLSSPKSYNSSAKGLVVQSSEVDSKPSTSVTDESKMRSLSVKQHIIDEKQSAEAIGEPNEDSDDDKPLSARLPAGLSNVNSNHAKKGPHASTSGQQPKIPKPEDSDDEIPLSSKFQVKSNIGLSLHRTSGSGERKPLLSRYDQNGSASTEMKPSTKLKKRPGDGVKTADDFILKKPKLSDTSKHKSKEASVKAEMREEDDEDHVPISHRMKKPIFSDKKSLSAKNMTRPKSAISKKTNKKLKKVMKNSKYSFKLPPGSGDGQKWTTLVHNGVIFPPPYKPHGVKMLYKGKPVDLTPEQEEVATMYSVMLDTDFLNKPQFKENFMADWRKILGKNHIIQSLEHCDFTPIYEWHQKEKEKKKKMTTEEKKALKEEKLQQEEKYMWAIVDGVKEKIYPALDLCRFSYLSFIVFGTILAIYAQVGNFRVEPPGLFRGRGEHPKMGKLKKRIRPSDITINIGKDAPIPDCPISGESWKEIRHDNTVTWLAYWNDPINPKEFKYVFLAASSTLKGQSDKEKYEKARLLKNYIQGIRAAYTKDYTSKDMAKRQIAVATYLIDKLALRAGNEKDDDEAETVGCCTLKVENVEPLPPNILKFDFLGKDSIRYQRELEVEIAVFKAIQQFRSGKKGGDDLFDKLDTSRLNAHLKSLMPGLTAKVFRTYNASITLDDMLSRETKGVDVAENIAVYNHANKEVAIICNHQRTESKSHVAQMLRLDEKIEELKGVVEELQTDLSREKKGRPPLKSADGKTKRNLNPDALERKIAQTMAKIEKTERDKETKEDLKTVALGTSKINYLDPRITVAWCKRHEVPIEKIFNKSLLAKFAWAMDVDPDFRF